MSNGDATAVREVLTALADACEAYREHERNHPTLIERHNAVLERLSHYLERSSRLHLHVTADSLVLGTERVYESGDPNSLPARLHRYGIREVELLPGIPSWELAAFIDSVNTTYDDAVDDDLVTALWERDLNHVLTTASVMSANVSWAADPLGTVTDYVRTLRELPTERKFKHIHLLESGKAPVDPAAEIDAMSLTAEELQTLKEMDRADRERDLALDVLNVLVHTLQESGASDDEILKLLTSAVMGHDSPAVRAGALQHAAQYSDDTVRDILIRGLQDESPEVRRTACTLAPRLADTRIIITLASLLRADEYGAWPADDKKAACRAYGRTAREESLQLLEELFLQARHDADRVAAAIGIVSVDTPEAEEMLRRLPADEPELAQAIERAREEVARIQPQDWEARS